MQPRHDATPNLPAPSKKRGILIAVGLTLLLTSLGALSVVAAFCSEGPLTPRILLLFLAAICFALPLWVAFVLLRRRLKTGQFSVTAEERAAAREKTVSQLNSASYRRNTRIINSVLIAFWVGLCSFWIIDAIHKPEKGLWAAFWFAIAVVNVYSSVNMIRKPSFAAGNGSGPATT